MIQLAITGIMLLCFVIYLITKKSDILKPFNIFTLMILSTLFISCMHLSRLQHTYSIAFILLILSLIMCFYIGTKIRIKKNKNTDSEFKYDYYNKRLKTVIYILFFVVTLSFIAMWVILGPPPLISKVERSTYFVSGFGTLYLLIDILSFLLIYDFYDRNVIKKFKKVIMLLIVIAMILMMSNKFQIIYLLCQFLVLYNTMKKKIKFKTLLKMGIAVILIFIFFYSVVYKNVYISNEEMYQANQMNIPSNMQILTNPYMYVSCNYENLYYYLGLDNVEHGFGYYIFKSVFEQFGLDKFIYSNYSWLSMQWKSNLQYKWLTTGTVFRELYMDFGYLGMYIGTFIIAMWSQYSYLRYKRDKSMFSLYLYVANTFSLFLVFFTNNFISITYLINIVFAYFISRFCFKKTKK